MLEHHLLFDRALYRKRRNKSAEGFEQHDFLHKLVEERAAERLDAMDKYFEQALIIGATTNTLSHHPKLGHSIFADFAPQRLPRHTHRCTLDEEMLPIANQSLDVIISLLSFHTINDIPGALIQMRRALKPDGLLLIITAGAQTLKELRESLAHGEMLSCGGLSPRVSPFLEVRDAGSLLQRAGLALPVVDNEILTLSYPNMLALTDELRKAGEAHIMSERKNHMTVRHIIQQADSYYRDNHSDNEGRISSTIELLYLTAWAPHPSQQAPAKRGSGNVNLHDFLK